MLSLVFLSFVFAADVYDKTELLRKGLQIETIETTAEVDDMIAELDSEVAMPQKSKRVKKKKHSALTDGEIVQSVKGQVVRSPAQALEIYNKLQNREAKAADEVVPEPRN